MLISPRPALRSSELKTLIPTPLTILASFALVSLYAAENYLRALTFMQAMLAAGKL